MRKLCCVRILLAIVALVLVRCGATPTSAPPTVEPLASVTAVSEPTATFTPSSVDPTPTLPDPTPTLPATADVSEERSPGMAVVQSDRARIVAPSVPPEDLTALVAGNNAFAYDLYRLMSVKVPGNFFYSPFSISQAMAMTYAGAHGTTEQQMADALSFALPQERLHPAFNALDQALAQRGQGAQGKDGEGFRLHVVNAIWGQADYAFRPDFLDVLAENYGSGLRVLDFARATEESRMIINRWVEEQTESRIKDLIPSGALDSLTRLVLTNAIYFNAAWETSFNESSTMEQGFYLADGSTVRVPMMRQTTKLGYAAGTGYQAVEIPYDGGELAMVVVLPDDMAVFEGQLTFDVIDALTRDLTYRRVSLSMPKFTFESQFRLAEALAALGMPDAFLQTADFSGMTDEESLFIASVIHKAFVSVDEAGTEAAAATAVIMAPTAIEPGDPVSVVLDHPFLFFIRDLETGTTLFVGRVMNPVAHE